MKANPETAKSQGYRMYAYTTVHRQDVRYAFEPKAPKQFVKDLDAVVEKSIGKDPGRYRVTVDDTIRRGKSDQKVFVSLLGGKGRMTVLQIRGWTIDQERPCLAKYSYKTTSGQNVGYVFKMGAPEQFMYAIDEVVRESIAGRRGRFTIKIDRAVKRAAGKSVIVDMLHGKNIDGVVEVHGWENVDSRQDSVGRAASGEIGKA